MHVTMEEQVPLSIPHIAGLLHATPAMLHAEIAALPPAVTRFCPAPGEWCVNAVIGHLSEAETRGFAGRIRHILTHHSAVCQLWDPDEVARQRRDHERSVHDLLAELVALRAQSISLVSTLTPEQLLRSGQHPVVGMLSVSDLLHEWLHHDRNHLKQIASNIQAYVWPSMGNAQRFSVPDSRTQP
jgi:hypothetical protein